MENRRKAIVALSIIWNLKPHVCSFNFLLREVLYFLYAPPYPAMPHSHKHRTLPHSHKHRTLEYPHWNERLSFNKRHTTKYSASPKYIWTYYTVQKTMKILSIFRFFNYIWFIDSKNLCFILILKQKMTKFWH